MDLQTLPDRLSREVADLIAELCDRPDLVLRPAAPLARLSTFRIGGAAELLAEVTSEAALVALLREVDARGLPLLVLGLGSNLLIPDEGLPGVVLRMGGELAGIRFAGRRVTAGAAVALGQLARRTVGQGLCGLEALSGFPSTVGGAVVMNAGCYGTEIADHLVATRVVDRRGEITTWTVADLEPGYRTTRLQGGGWIVVDAELELTPGDPVTGLAEIQRLNRKRRASLPSDHPNAGSVFRNPPGDFAGRLIDTCGLKGLRRGGAQVSPKHGNVIVNTGDATAADVLDLMLAVRDAVTWKSRVRLEPELVLTGVLRERWQSECAARDAIGAAARSADIELRPASGPPDSQL